MQQHQQTRNWIVDPSHATVGVESQLPNAQVTLNCSIMADGQTKLKAMYSERPNLFARRQHSKCSSRSEHCPSQTAAEVKPIPALRIELCDSSSFELCSANSFTCYNESQELLSSTSSESQPMPQYLYEAQNSASDEDTAMNERATASCEREPVEELSEADITRLIGADTTQQDFIASMFAEQQLQLASGWHNPSASYLCGSRGGSIRETMVAWLSKCGSKWQLQKLTTHLAIHYLDKVCSSQQLNLAHLKMMALSCLLVAIKFNEREDKVQPLRRLARMCDKRLPPSSIKMMEVKILNYLSFRLKCVLPIHFATYYLDAGSIFEDDRIDEHTRLNEQGKCKAYLHNFVHFFLDLSLQSYAFTNYVPSTMALAVIIASRRALRFQPYYNCRLLTTCRADNPGLLACFSQLWTDYKTKFAAEARVSDSLQPLGLERYI